MSKVRGRDTEPERIVRSIAHSMGLRFRLHRKELPGRPDLVFPKHRLAIFVHGCFWHRHIGCKKASFPKTRPEFWHNKFAANVRRDNAVVQELKKNGWKVGIIWECETNDYDSLKERISEIIRHR